MSDSPIADMQARAAASDLNRQRQIEAQKQIVNRLLEARESETDDASLIKDLCEERRELVQRNLELQARIDEAIGISEVAKRDGNASHIVEHMAIVLASSNDG